MHSGGASIIRCPGISPSVSAFTRAVALGVPNDSSGWPVQLARSPRRAEQKRDAEGLAFCAVRIRDKRESARLAEEAVRLDPNLVWVYAVVAVRHPELGEISEWVPKLEQWDPQNALSYMITAESNDVFHVVREDIRARGLAKDPVWRTAMAAAFQSPKFNDYLHRAEAMDRKVVSAYGLPDPNLVLLGSGRGLPPATLEDSQEYADSLFEFGKNLQARGDLKGAMEKYWSVASYGQMIDFWAYAIDEHMLGVILQGMAYQQLRAVSEKEGEHSKAAHFAYYAARFDPRRDEHDWLLRDVVGQDVPRWNALEVNASGLMMLIFAGWVTAAASILTLRRRGTGPKDLRAKRVAAKVCLTGAVGLFLSSAKLYFAYHPYEEILDRILNGDRSGVGDLRVFLAYTQGLPFVSSGAAWRPYAYYGNLNLIFYFWLAVIVLGVMGLLFLAVRNFRSHPRANVPV